MRCRMASEGNFPSFRASRASSDDLCSPQSKLWLHQNTTNLVQNIAVYISICYVYINIYIYIYERLYVTFFNEKKHVYLNGFLVISTNFRCPPWLYPSMLDVEPPEMAEFGRQLRKAWEMFT